MVEPAEYLVVDSRRDLALIVFGVCLILAAAIFYIFVLAPSQALFGGN